METEVLQKLGFPNWSIIPYFDEFVTVKSRQALEKYDDIKFFKENEGKLQHAEAVIRRKNEVTKLLKAFLNDNDYKSQPQYNRIEKEIDVVLNNARAFRVSVNYISSAGNHLGEKELTLTRHGIDKFKRDPSLLMGKGEYNRYLKEQQKEALSQNHHQYYEKVNKVID